MTGMLYATRHPEFSSGSRIRRVVFPVRGPGLHRDDDRFTNNNIKTSLPHLIQTKQNRI